MTEVQIAHPESLRDRYFQTIEAITTLLIGETCIIGYKERPDTWGKPELSMVTLYDEHRGWDRIISVRLSLNRDQMTANIHRDHELPEDEWNLDVYDRIRSYIERPHLVAVRPCLKRVDSNVAPWMANRAQAMGAVVRARAAQRQAT